MMTYLVVWEIELDAESCVEAAHKALEIHRDPDSTAVVFQVRKYQEGNGELVMIDLAQPETWEGLDDDG